MPAITREGYAAGQQITKRLDALGSLQSGFLGVSVWFIRVHVIAGGAWAMAAAQIMTYAYMDMAIIQDLPMTKTETAFLLLGANMFGAFVGAFIFGHLADIHGRKLSMLLAFAIAHGAGTLCAVIPSVHVLICFRFIVGIGLGGQQPTIAALIMELSPTNVRGSALVFMDAFWPIGATVAMVFSREVEPLIGWRAVVGLSVIALAYLPLLYLYVPESPKWLASTGKIDEAVRVLRTIEEASSVFHGEEVDDVIRNLVLRAEAPNGTKPMILQAHKPSFCKSLGDHLILLLRFPYLSRTLLLWFVWTAVTMTNSAMCILMDEQFVAQVADPGDKTLLVYSVLIAQLCGNFSSCALINRLGRRYTMICFIVVGSAASLVELYLDRTTVAMLISSSCRNFCFFGAFGCLFAYTPELYPTTIRVIGIGYAWGVSRIGFFAGPQLVLWMEERWGTTPEEIVWVFCGILAVAATAVFFFGIETANQDTDKIGRRSTRMSTDRETDGTALSYQQHDDDDEPAILQSNSSVSV